MTVEDRMPSPMEAEEAHDPRASDKLLTLCTITVKTKWR